LADYREKVRTEDVGMHSCESQDIEEKEQEEENKKFWEELIAYFP
jgi:hypothetical protein